MAQGGLYSCLLREGHKGSLTYPSAPCAIKFQADTNTAHLTEVLTGCV